MSGLVLHVHQSPDSEKAQRIVDILMWKLGVKLLALDFDLTLLDIDSGSGKQPPGELESKHFRPCFRFLIPAALKSHLLTCVVTFNRHKDLVEGVLKHAFPNCNIDEDIPIDTFPKRPKGVAALESVRFGKEKHITRVCSNLEKQKGINIGDDEIFLFDDYEPNIRAAKKNKHMTFKVKGNITLDAILVYVEGLPAKVSEDTISKSYADTFKAKKPVDGNGNGESSANEATYHGGSLVTRVIVQQNVMQEWKGGGIWSLKSSAIVIAG